MLQIVLATFFVNIAWVAKANSGAFLANTGSVSRMEIEQNLLAELADALDGRRSIGQIEELMRPMFDALPKNAWGNLERPTIRYALHRYFVQRHGWYVKGLDPAGAAWSNVSTDMVAKDRVPEFIQGVFEKSLGGVGHGLGLRELAIFAATLEDLVHNEAAVSLREVYMILGLSLEGRVSYDDADRAIAAHMANFIRGGNLSNMSLEDMKLMETEISAEYPAWDDTLLWIQDMRRTWEYTERHRRNPFRSDIDFVSVENALDTISQKFGAFQDDECRSLKKMLTKMEYKSTGRVRLSDFWGRGLDGDWQFTESEEYLRQVGALDESGWTTSVIIPNYISSASNCIASSSFFSICCRDECEGMLGEIERKIGTPAAKPSEIIELISAMPSDTVDAPRKLSPDLLARLDEIANLHAGAVPLHGRLFAQWMHHAYPRECPFPHASGTTNPLTPDEWMARTGDDGLASETMMKNHVEMAKMMKKSHVDEALPWTAHEELVWDESLQVSYFTIPSGRAILRSVVFITLLSAVGSLLLRTMQATAEDFKLGQYV
jgi:hypothetical protein